jgi:GNAT superfamily N-acetyltransferase
LLQPGDEGLLCRAEAMFNPTPTMARAAMLLREPTFVMVVALDDADEVMSRIYGHVLHRHDTSDFIMYEVDTDERHQRKGAARAIVHYLKDLGRRRGWAELWVLTDHDNNAGNGLYRAAGGALENSPANMYVFPLTGS